MTSFFKYFLKLILIILSINTVCLQEEKSNLVCTKEFCDNYKEQFSCPPLSTDCIEPGNGIKFPSATPCSCCEICLDFIPAGNYCSIGAPGFPVPQSICGPGLYCSKITNDDNPRCLPMSHTDCFKEQIAFDELKAKDNGTYTLIGRLMQRPICDGDGNYGPIKCIPGQTCYCVDKKGKRIFGEALHSNFTEITMKCECSRSSAIYKDLAESRFPEAIARCQDDGSFDPLQCIDDQCICVNQYYGTQINNNIYDSKLGFNKIPCYDPKIHRPSRYLRECEAVEMDLMEELYQYENDGFNILDFNYTSCEENGWYAKIQETSEFKFCADKYGQPIDNFTVAKDSPDAHDMNCLCARTKELIPDIDCCPNGNFKKIMCKNEKCYCLDKNGNQISAEVMEYQIETLSCYQEGNLC